MTLSCQFQAIGTLTVYDLVLECDRDQKIKQIVAVEKIMICNQS